jgi:hypothetical protein
MAVAEANLLTEPGLQAGWRDLPAFAGGRADSDRDRMPFLGQGRGPTPCILHKIRKLPH